MGIFGRNTCQQVVYISMVRWAWSFVGPPGSQKIAPCMVDLSTVGWYSKISKILPFRLPRCWLHPTHLVQICAQAPNWLEFSPVKIGVKLSTNIWKTRHLDDDDFPTNREKNLLRHGVFLGDISPIDPITLDPSLPFPLEVPQLLRAPWAINFHQTYCLTSKPSWAMEPPEDCRWRWDGLGWSGNSWESMGCDQTQRIHGGIGMSLPTICKQKST